MTLKRDKARHYFVAQTVALQEKTTQGWTTSHDHNPPEQLKRRFSLWTYAHAGVFLLALGGLGYVWRMG